MLEFKKRSSNLLDRKANALSIFSKTRETLTKLMADQAGYGMQIEDKIFELVEEKDLMQREYDSTAKIVRKIDDFLS